MGSRWGFGEAGPALYVEFGASDAFFTDVCPADVTLVCEYSAVCPWKNPTCVLDLSSVFWFDSRRRSSL